MISQKGPKKEPEPLWVYFLHWLGYGGNWDSAGIGVTGVVCWISCSRGGESRSPVPGDSGSCGEIIFFQCSDRAGAGHFQGIWTGFPDRIDGIAATFLYRNYFLYDESVFYGSRGQKNPLYTSRGADGDSLRDVHEHFNGKSWLFVRKL